MRKALSIILVLIMCLSLCACGKSEEVNAVEEIITAIGEVSVDSKDAILKAEEAYNALSDADQGKVENYTILEEAKTALKKALFSSIVDNLCTVNTGSDTIASSVILVWENVGGKDFWTWYNSILKFQDESLANMDETDEKNNGLYYEMPAYALGRTKSTFADIPIEERQDIVDTCTVLANTYFGIIDMDEQLNKDITEFIELFGDAYPDESTFLREWYLESSVFVEFATNPNGARLDYQTQHTEYNSEMVKFQKEANLMK